MLARKFALFVLLPLLVLLAAGQAFVYFITSAELRTQRDDGLIAAANALDRSFSNRLDSIRDDLEVMAAYRQLGDYFRLLDFGRPEQADRRLVELEENYVVVAALKPLYKAFRFYDTEGLSRISVVDGERSYKQIDVGDTEWHRTALAAQDEQSRISRVHLDPAEERPSLTVFRPVRFGDAVRGVLAVDIQIQALAADLLPAARAASGGYVYLVGPSGAVVAWDGAGAPLGDQSGQRTTQRVLDGYRGVSSVESETGEMMRVAYVPQAESELGLVLAMPYDELFAPVHRMRELVVPTTALAVLFVALTGLWLVRRTVRPVRLLTDGARRITEGELGTTLDVQTGDEIETLADSFNRMTRSLQAAHDSERQINRDLVESVATAERRSAALERALHELQETQRQLAQAEKLGLLGQLAGGIAHDFNNLLGGILGSADLLQRGAGTTEERERYVEIIVKTGQRAADLVRQLLAFARPAPASHDSLDMHEVIDEVIRILRPTIDPRIEIRSRLKAKLTTIDGDRSAVQSALLNLGVNARDAMPDGGTITFTTADAALDPETCRRFGGAVKPGPFLQIDVADTGTGIPRDVRERIFEPFFTTKEPGKGTGLGLAAVYGTVHGHEGVISVYSEPGEGTLFKIFLPAAAEGAAARRIPEVVKGSGRILIVDDEPVIRNLARDMLRGLGYEVALANGGPEALDFYCAEGDSIDLVILDLVMPEMNGAEVLRALKRIDPKVRVLIASGFHLDMDAPDLKRDGANGFLSKPFIVADLSQAVASAMVGVPDTTGPLRILIAEDSPINREVIGAQMRELGHTAEMVEDGEAAVARAQADSFDLILMDVQMPEMDGIEATEAIRAAGSAVPIVAMTGRDSEADQDRCLEAGMNGFLAKPMMLDTLRTAITRAVRVRPPGAH
ncbi:MAG: response regulator [Planctomycetota bacterium]